MQDLKVAYLKEPADEEDKLVVNKKNKKYEIVNKARVVMAGSYKVIVDYSPDDGDPVTGIDCDPTWGNED